MWKGTASRTPTRHEDLRPTGGLQIIRRGAPNTVAGHLGFAAVGIEKPYTGVVFFSLWPKNYKESVGAHSSAPITDGTG
jgi:hypothetical protein